MQRLSVQNDYYAVFDGERRLSHVELKISQNDQEIVAVQIDTKDRALVAERKWVAYYQEKERYWNIRSADRDKIRLARYIMRVKDRNKFVDHRDRNTLNMRRDNLRIVGRSANAHNRRFRADNSTSRTGIHLWQQGKYWQWTAKGVSKGKRYAKSFGVQKYGFEEAKRLATEFRQQFEKEHNVLSATTMEVAP